MAKNSNKLILSLITTVLSILGLILFFTTSFLARNEEIDNYTRIYYDGDIKTRLGDAILTLNDSDFPDAVTILGIIGLVLIILGSLYYLSLAATKNDCLLSKRKAPGPIAGILFLLGGLLGFIGLMVFLPYGIDYLETFSSFSYGFGFIFTLIITILFLLVGVFLLILTFTKKDKKRITKKKKK
jgi:hypothetical protein